MGVRTANPSGKSKKTTPFMSAIVDVPDAVTIGTVTVLNTTATIPFLVTTGGTPSSFYATANPGGAIASSAASPITFSGLTDGVQYTFTVQAFGAGKYSPVSNVSNQITATATAPSAPTIGTLTYVNVAYGGSPQFYIAFTTPTSNGGLTITGYKYSTDGGTTYKSIASTTSPLTLTTDSTGASFVVGNSYTVYLKATNSKGDSTPSASSNVLTAATAPSQPAASNTTTGATNLTLNYSYNTGGSAVTSYTPTISPFTSTSVSGTSPVGNTSGSLSFTGSYAQGFVYSANMTVTNAVGTSPISTSSGATPYPATAPSAPASLSAAIVSTTQVTLSYGAISTNGSALTAWTGSGTSTGDITCTPAINLTYSGTPNSGGSTVLVTGAFVLNQAYTFTLRARNSVGQGSGASSGSVTPNVVASTLLVTTTGAGSWTVPVGVTSATVESWGAGGGSMGQDNSNGASSGGAYAKSVISVTPGNTVYYSVGVGGTGAQASGGSGQDSWVNKAANSAPSSSSNGVLAKGGSGAPVASLNNSTQLANSVGTTIYIGGAGQVGAEFGAGAGASSFGNGGQGAAANGGTGGSSPSAGAGGTGGSTGNDGADGVSNVEGGGAGGSSYNYNGGNGGSPGGAGGAGYGLSHSTPLSGTNTNTHGYGGNGGRGQVRIIW